MFPFDMEDDEIFPDAEDNGMPSDYEIDFRTGKLTGRVITGIEAVMQWAKIALSIDRYVYPQFSWNYGSELNTLIGQNYDKEYIESEAKRMIEDALTVHEDILGIDEFECSFEKDKLTASFVVETNYGRGEMSV